MSQWSNVPESPSDGLPVPWPNDISRPHWDGCMAGKLLVQCCDDCGTYVFTPEAACTSCFSAQLTWVESSGRGEIYSYSVVHRPQRPEFDTPYVIVIVALEEGWHMLSNLIDCDPDTIAVGDRVKVNFQRRGEFMLPMFRLEANGQDRVDV